MIENKKKNNNPSNFYNEEIENNRDYNKIVIQAYEELFKKDWNKNIRLKVNFSGHLKPYGAYIKMVYNNVTFVLHKNWKNVSDSILIGLFQELYLKLYNKKILTFNIELYNDFIKKLHKIAPKNKIDPVLLNSFENMNEKFFNGKIELTNLKWNNSFVKLGSYDYKTDTITITKYLKDRKDLIDFVMYHEMLHKLFKFKLTKNGQALHHSYAFRKKEKEYPNYEKIEEELNNYIDKQRKEYKKNIKKKRKTIFDFFKS